MDPILESKVEDDNLVDFNRSDSIDLLGDCQNAMENAVIIYDTGLQEQQMIKYVSDPESNSQIIINTEDPDNTITLHASSEDNVNNSNVVHDNVDELPQSEEPEVDSDDDETIATFITSSGQQLALYAVEDSDEVFAVAVYDESGAPPTNFHFLLKADVEKLIGEGAVKTVKKPSAQKKDVKSLEQASNEDKSCQDVKPEVQKDQSPDIVVKKEVKEDILETIVETIEIGPADTEMTDESPEKEIETQITNNNQTEAISNSPKSSQPMPVSTTKIVQATSSTKKIEVTPPSLEKSAVSKINHQSNLTSMTKIAQSSMCSTSKLGQKTITTPVKISHSAPTKITRVDTSSTQKVGQTITPKVGQTIVPKVSQTTTPKVGQTIIRKAVQTPSRIGQTLMSKTQALSPRKVTKTVQSSPFYTKKILHPTPTKITKILPKPSLYQPVNIKKEDSKITYLVSQNNRSYAIENADDLDSDVEIIEQSTVQYILCDDSHSDTEMTFDELQQSLQVFKSNKSNLMNSKTSSSTSKHDRKKETIFRYSPTKLIKSSPVVVLQRDSTIAQYNKSPKKSRTKNNILQSHRKIKKEVEDPSYDFPFADYSLNSTDDQVNAFGTEAVKAKRSRKQQLTVVNRTDSEIIIQPAAMFAETEDEPIIAKKRGRRKKRESPDPDYNPRKAQKKNKKHSRSVELIEIDVDENDSLNRTKGKGSSDKENDDVISLGEDSDDGDDDDDDYLDADTSMMMKKKKPLKLSKPMMKCCHCERNFRKRKLLERHLQVCLNVPGNAEKIAEQKQSLAKRFKCKYCDDEYFDIAVALARHVRVVHSTRKKSNPVKSRDDMSSTTEVEDSLKDDEEDEDEESEPEFEPRRRGRPPSKKTKIKAKLIGPVSQNSRLESSKEPAASEQPRRRPGRPPLKKNLPKERPLSPNSDEKSLRKSTETKDTSPSPQDSKLESPNDPAASEVRRRPGRPPVKKYLSKERSITPVRSTSTEDEPSSKVSSTPLQPLKKRGRPSKTSMSGKEISVSPPPNEERTAVNSPKTVPLQIPKKRGRPSFKSFSNDSPDGEKAESSTAATPTARKKSISDPEDEPQKSSEPESISLEKENKNEERSDTNEESLLKKSRISKDEIQDEGNQKEKAISSDESAVEPLKKRGRPPKDKSAKEVESASSDQEEKNAGPKNSSEEPPLKKHKKSNDDDTHCDDKEEEKIQSTSESIVEAKKRGRPPKDQSVKDRKEEDDLNPDSKLESQKDEKIGLLIEESKNEDHEDLSESFVEPKKRGRPPRDKISRDSKTDESEEEVPDKYSKTDKVRPSKIETQDKDDNSSELISEPKKRGRPPRDKSSKVDKIESSDKDAVKSKLSKEEQVKSSESESEEKPLNRGSEESLSEEEKIKSSSTSASSAESKTRGLSNRKSVDFK